MILSFLRQFSRFFETPVTFGNGNFLINKILKFYPFLIEKLPSIFLVKFPNPKISRENKERNDNRVSISALSKYFSRHSLFLSLSRKHFSSTHSLHALAKVQFGFADMVSPLIAAPPSSSLLFSASTPAVSIIDQFPFRGPGNRTHL